MKKIQTFKEWALINGNDREKYCDEVRTGLIEISHRSEKFHWDIIGFQEKTKKENPGMVNSQIWRIMVEKCLEQEHFVQRFNKWVDKYSIDRKVDFLYEKRDPEFMKRMKEVASELRIKECREEFEKILLDSRYNQSMNIWDLDHYVQKALKLEKEKLLNEIYHG